MNHDVTVSTTLCCCVVTLLCASLYMPFLDSLAHGCPTYTGYMARWHLVAQLYDLALGCPTLRRSQVYDMLLHGTTVPNARSGQSAVHII